MPWCTSQARTSSRVCGCGLTSSATCSLERYAPYLKRRRHVNKGASRGEMGRTCLGCAGSLTSESASIKALSRSGLSAIWRLIIAPEVVFPRLSQLAGTSFQVCLTHISSQCMADVAKSASNTAIRKDGTESQWHHMRTGGQRRSVTNVWLRTPKQQSAEKLLKTWLRFLFVAFHCQNRGNRSWSGTAQTQN